MSTIESVKDFEKTIYDFVRGLNVTPEYVEELKKFVLEQWNQRQEATKQDTTSIDIKIQELQASSKASADKIKFLSSGAAIKYMEEDIVKAENEINDLESTKAQKILPQSVNMETVMARVGYFLEHLENLLIDSPNPLRKAALFGLVFDRVPTYAELSFGTPKLAPYIGLKGASGHLSIPIGEPRGIRT